MAPRFVLPIPTLPHHGNYNYLPMSLVEVQQWLDRGPYYSGVRSRDLCLIFSAPQADILAISPYEGEKAQLHHDGMHESIDTDEQPLHIIEMEPEEWMKGDNKLEYDDWSGEEEADKLEPVTTKEPKKQDAFIGKLLAIEVLCPNCGNSCADPKTGSLMITEDLIGHTVTCIECHTASLVPLNAHISW